MIQRYMRLEDFERKGAMAFASENLPRRKERRAQRFLDSDLETTSAARQDGQYTVLPIYKPNVERQYIGSTLESGNAEHVLKKTVLHRVVRKLKKTSAG